jgi:redox-sensing transcriptional repressor
MVTDRIGSMPELTSKVREVAPVGRVDKYSFLIVHVLPDTEYWVPGVSAVVGTGHLGMALMGYKGFRNQGFNIVAAFDSDERKVGRMVNGVEIHSIRSLPSIVSQKSIHMAMLTVPADVAQNVADQVVRAGIKALLNFAPVRLSLPETVKIRHIDMTIEIERLSFLVSRG